MTAGELCLRDVVVVTQQDTVLTAARRMLDYNVGCLIVVEQDGQGDKPVGIVTDRDLTLKVIAGDAKPSSLKIGAVMTETLLAAVEIERIYDVLQKMNHKGVRRLPVVDEKGYLQGLLTADDILEFVNQEMSEIIGVIRKEQPKI